MKSGLLLKFNPVKYNPGKCEYLGVLLGYYPPISPNIAYIRILWTDGSVGEVYWGYEHYEREWEILS